MSSKPIYSSSTDCIELLSTQGSNPLANIQIKNTKLVTKIFDKEVKSFVVRIEGSSFHTTNIEIPKTANSTLQIMHRYLVIQCSFGAGFQIEINVRDKKQIKKRMIFSSAFKSITKTQLHAQINIPETVHPDEWMNMCFDLHDLVGMSFNDTEEYYCLDRIIIGPLCTIRKIFTLRQNPLTEEVLPKKVSFTHSGDNYINLVDSSCYMTEEDIQALNNKKKQVVDRSVLGSSKEKPHIAFGRRMKSRPTTGVDAPATTETSFFTEPKPQTAAPRMQHIDTSHTTSRTSTASTNKTAPIVTGRAIVVPPIQKQNNILMISHNTTSEATTSRYHSQEDIEEIQQESMEELRILRRPPKEEYNPSHYQHQDNIIVMEEEEIIEEDPPLVFDSPKSRMSKVIQKNSSLCEVDRSLTSSKTINSSSSLNNEKQLFQHKNHSLEDNEVDMGIAEFSDEEDIEEEDLEDEDSILAGKRQHNAISTVKSYKFKGNQSYNPSMFESDDDLVVVGDSTNDNEGRSKFDTLIGRHITDSSTNFDSSLLEGSVEGPTIHVCTVNVGMDEFIEEHNSRRFFDTFDEGSDDEFRENLVQSFENVSTEDSKPFSRKGFR